MAPVEPRSVWTMILGTYGMSIGNITKHMIPNTCHRTYHLFLNKLHCMGILYVYYTATLQRYTHTPGRPGRPHHPNNERLVPSASIKGTLGRCQCFVWLCWAGQACRLGPFFDCIKMLFDETSYVKHSVCSCPLSIWCYRFWYFLDFLCGVAFGSYNSPPPRSRSNRCRQAVEYCSEFLPCPLVGPMSLLLFFSVRISFDKDLVFVRWPAGVVQLFTICLGLGKLLDQRSNLQKSRHPPQLIPVPSQQAGLEKAAAWVVWMSIRLWWHVPFSGM